MKTTHVSHSNPKTVMVVGDAGGQENSGDWDCDDGGDNGDPTCRTGEENDGVVTVSLEMVKVGDLTKD